MIKKTVIHCIVLGFLALGSAGCLNTQYVESHQYLLMVPKARMVKKSPCHNAVLLIDQPTAVSPFDGLHFIYHTQYDRFIGDYYHSFFIAPSQQMGRVLPRYFRQTQLFQNVINDLSLKHYDYELQSQIVELYADYHDSAKPRAVMAIHFNVFQKNSKNHQPLMDKTFRKERLLKQKETESLLSAWNQEFAVILDQLAQQLQKLKC